jgi:hypothetical protein
LRIGIYECRSRVFLPVAVGVPIETHLSPYLVYHTETGKSKCFSASFTAIFQYQEIVILFFPIFLNIVMDQLTKEAMTMIVAAHEVIFLDRAVIVEEGTHEQIFDNPNMIVHVRL